MQKCLRCGWCCIAPRVAIVKPEFIDSRICIDKTLEYFDKITDKPEFTICPHLKYNDSGISRCIVHDKEWYSTTVCAGFSTISLPAIWYPKEFRNMYEECRIGKFIKENYPKDWWKTWWEFMPPPV